MSYSAVAYILFLVFHGIKIAREVHVCHFLFIAFALKFRKIIVEYLKQKYIKHLNSAWNALILWTANVKNLPLTINLVSNITFQSYFRDL